MNHLKIDLDKCVGCGKCAKMCLKNNIVIEDRKAKEVGTDCLECSHCVSSCPKGAIELLPRAKEDETVFSSIKKDKMFDGGMVSDKDLAELVESMTQGRKDRYEIFVLQGDELNSFMDTVWDVLKDKEATVPMVKEWGKWRDSHDVLQPSPVLWEGQQVLFIFSDSKQHALMASQRMVRKGLSLRIRGFHSNIIMSAYLFGRDKVLGYFPDSTKELQMAYVIGHARRLVEPVFKPMNKVKGLFDRL